MKRLCISILMLGLIVMSFAFGEKIYLKSGDTITGEIIAMSQGVCVVQTKYGTLQVSATDISTIAFKPGADISKKGVIFENGDHLMAKLTQVKDGTFTFESNYGLLIVKDKAKIRTMNFGFEAKDILKGKKFDERKLFILNDYERIIGRLVAFQNDVAVVSTDYGRLQIKREDLSGIVFSGVGLRMPVVNEVEMKNGDIFTGQLSSFKDGNYTFTNDYATLVVQKDEWLSRIGVNPIQKNEEIENIFRNITAIPSLKDWLYSRKIRIKENSGKTLKDYQILVRLNPSNFTFSKAKSDGSDIRFVDEMSGEELSYWIEKWDASAKEARIWVKVPNIPASSETKIRMYYGNPKAGAMSNGDKTFIFFDDFDDGVFDTNKWGRFGTFKYARTDPRLKSDIYENNGVMNAIIHITDHIPHLITTVPLPNKLTIESKKKVHAANEYFLGHTSLLDNSAHGLFSIRYSRYYYGGGSVGGRIIYANRESFFILSDIGGKLHGDQKLSPFWDSIWFRETIKYNGDTGEVTYTRNKGDGDQTITDTTGKTSGSTKIEFVPSGWYTGHYIKMDYIFVRSYSSIEPTVTISGE